MFKRIIEIDRNNATVVWPSEDPAKAALYLQLRELRATFPGFVSVEVVVDDISSVRTEIWESQQAFLNYFNAPEVRKISDQLGFDAYLEANGMFKTVRDEVV